MARPSICTSSAESLGGIGAELGVSIQSAWPVANDALFVPFVLQRTIFVKRMYTVNGSVASGNVDVGIYSIDGKKMIAKGSTAQSGTAALQFYDITDQYITPGQYYMAVAMDNTTGRIGRFNISIIRQQVYGVFKMASAFPLPDTATFATVTNTIIPSIGMELFGVL